MLYVSVAFVIVNFFTKKTGIDTGDSYTDELLNTALEHLEKIRLLRSAIWNDSLRSQIESLEKDAHQIIEVIKKYPDKMVHISQFFLYYLPSTLKLINNYKELEGEGRAGTNHTAGMEKIEGFMGELVTAYHKVLDDLYKDQVMETSINIEVMEKMLRQDEYLAD
jgi:5-bromo-4-chloroindolyl phosphate hydrolysis protein